MLKSLLSRFLNIKVVSNLVWTAGLLFCAGAVFADSSMTIGGMASQITTSFTNLAKLITAMSYLAGMGFAIASIFKFKQHKDAPTQTTIGAPIALLFIGAALLFFPTIVGITGATMFGAGGGQMAGPTGTVLTGS